MKPIIFLTFLLLPVTAFGQVSGVQSEYGEMLPSRGAFTVVKGANLASATELAVDVSNLPTDLGGVRVEIDGVVCRLRYVSPDIIRMVIPDEVPFIPPVRLRPNNLTIKTTTGAVLWTRRVYLNDTSPWLIPAVNTNFPVGVQVWPSGWSGIPGGVLQPGSRVQIWATGARSFYPVDWVSYSVWVVTQSGDTFSTPANVSKSGVVEGIDYVTFDVPIEWLGLGACRLILQTPSAFSQEVEVVL